jgi:tRNA (pseudouridine54-N1)-methyltransferase
VPRFVVIGQKAAASGEYLPGDLPGTSGRLDVLLRCVRAALLWSHGMRSDAMIYLVLCGGPRAPRVLRIDGAEVRFVRPDEYSLAILAKKALATRSDETVDGFFEIRPGLAVARGGLETVLADLGSAPSFVLEEGAPDIRDVTDVDMRGAVFFVGDHLGFDDATRARLATWNARPIGVGPRSLHAEDAITVLLNELDRREPAADQG